MFSTMLFLHLLFFFFFNDTATTEIYTLSLHDALPIRSRCSTTPTPSCRLTSRPSARSWRRGSRRPRTADRKSTRLNSSHDQISYAVFCLKKKKRNQKTNTTRTKKKKKTE